MPTVFLSKSLMFLSTYNLHFTLIFKYSGVPYRSQSCRDYTLPSFGVSSGTLMQASVIPPHSAASLSCSLNHSYRSLCFLNWTLENTSLGNLYPAGYSQGLLFPGVLLCVSLCRQPWDFLGWDLSPKTPILLSNAEFKFCFNGSNRTLLPRCLALGFIVLEDLWHWEAKAF